MVEKNTGHAGTQLDMAEQDRIEFLTLMKHKIKLAGPEDYKPYDFEDTT
jgi:hypothetical protein